MKKKMTIVLICAVILLLAVAVVLICNHCSSQAGNETQPSTPAGAQTPTDGENDPTNPTGGKEDPTTPSGGNDDPTEPSNGADDPTPPNGTTSVTFPYKIREYDLEIVKMAPFSGTFVEDGTNVTVENVAMLMVQNNGTLPVEYAQITVVCGEESLVFEVSALPSGEKLVVQEATAKAIPDSPVTQISAVVAQGDDMELSATQVQVTDNGDNTLTIRNLTDETITTIRVFYKYYMEEEEIFVGGIAFTVRITRLSAGADVTIQPSHFTSQNSRVVMVLTYDSEV